MKFIFFAFALFLAASVVHYLPEGRWALGLTIHHRDYGISFNQVGFWLLMVAGSIIILAQVIGDIIRMIARVRAHH